MIKTPVGKSDGGLVKRKALATARAFLILIVFLFLVLRNIYFLKLGIGNSALGLFVIRNVIADHKRELCVRISLFFFAYEKEFSQKLLGYFEVDLKIILHFLLFPFVFFLFVCVGFANR